MPAMARLFFGEYLILVNWTRELKLLDDLCDHPLSDSIRA